MKKFIRNIFILTVGLFLVQGCEYSPAFSPADSTSGWIEFRSGASTTGQSSPTHDLLIDIQVPQYPAGLTLNYDITAVEGDFTQFIPEASGSLFIDPEQPNRAATPLTLELNNMEVGRDFVTVFDVTITSISNNVRAGVDENSILTHRVTIPCSNPAVLPDDYFVGDYTVSGGVSAIASAFSVFPDGVVTLFADPDNPNVRAFLNPQPYAPLNGQPSVVEIVFSADTNTVTMNNEVAPGITCGGVPTSFAGAALSASNPWDICNDGSITIVYLEDFAEACGGPFTNSFTLTKVN